MYKATPPLGGHKRVTWSWICTDHRFVARTHYIRMRQRVLAHARQRDETTETEDQHGTACWIRRNGIVYNKHLTWLRHDSALLHGRRGADFTCPAAAAQSQHSATNHTPAHTKSCRSSSDKTLLFLRSCCAGTTLQLLDSQNRVFRRADMKWPKQLPVLWQEHQEIPDFQYFLHSQTNWCRTIVIILT